MDFISILSIFVLACFVGYFVVWSVTPALHTPLMAVTNAISSVIIVGALIAAAAPGGGDASTTSKWLGLIVWRWPASISSAAFRSPRGCWRCTRKRNAEVSLATTIGWVMAHRFWVALTIVLFFGYSVGKDVALRDNKSVVAESAEAM